MPNSLPTSIDGVVHVEVLRGAHASPDRPPDLLVEVPHGADRRRHYHALRGRLKGALPEGLEIFFHVNTDVGAWDYGRAAAEFLVAAEPQRAVLLLRCLLPRTFVDCNRPPDYAGGDLNAGAMTAGIPTYVKDEQDRALLLDLHRRYAKAAEQAYRAVCGRGGLALVPHTYGPVTLGISSIGDDIVTQLRWAHEPERLATWPVRPEIDLITRDGEGAVLSPPGMEETLLAAFREAGFSPTANATYHMHPSTLGYAWSKAYPARVVCLEVRRDLLVARWTPFEEMTADPAGARRIGAVLAAVLRPALPQPTSP